MKLAAKTSGVYKIANKLNNRFYIGSSKDIIQRIKDHCSKLASGKHCNSGLQRDCDHFGLAAFQFDVLELCDQSQLEVREQEYLDYSGCLDSDIGYNLAPKAGIPPMTAETKIKIGNANRGKPSWIKGKRHSEDTKQKISLSNIGNHMTGRCGDLHPFYGKKHSVGSIAKMSEAKKGRLNNHSSRPVERINHDGATVIYPSAREAERQTGINSKNIAACLLGKRKLAGGFGWRYAS